MNNQKYKGFSDAIKMISIPMETYQSSLALQRELVEALRKDHRELMDEAVIGGWERHEQYGPCNACALITRAEATL